MGSNVIMLQVVLLGWMDGQWPTPPTSWPAAGCLLVGCPVVVFVSVKLFEVRNASNYQHALYVSPTPTMLIPTNSLPSSRASSHGFF